MKLSNLSDALKKLECHWAASGNSALAQACGQISGALENRASETLATFTKPPKVKKPALRREPSAPKVATNLEAIENALQELKGAGTNQAELERVLALVKTDKSIKLADIREVADRYTGIRAAHKSKKAALEFIEATFVDQQRSDGKMALIEKKRQW